MRIRPPHYPGAFYHVMLRGNRKQTIFHDDGDRRHLSRLISRGASKYVCEVHAFCWMSNHIHLLVRVADAPVYRLVHYFATLYANYFNQRHQLVGHLFQGRYRSRHVTHDGYFLQLVRYIHRNPRDAGLVTRAADYPWSSLPAYLGHAHVDWLTQACALAYFGGNRARLRRFVELDQDLVEPWSPDDRVKRPRPVPEKSYPPSRGSAPDLDQLIDRACQRFRVTREDLVGASIARHLTLVRCWICQAALETHAATLSQVARRLNRSPPALSKSLRRNAARLRKVNG